MKMWFGVNGEVNLVVRPLRRQLPFSSRKQEAMTLRFCLAAKLEETRDRGLMTKHFSPDKGPSMWNRACISQAFCIFRVSIPCKCMASGILCSTTSICFPITMEAHRHMSILRNM